MFAFRNLPNPPPQKKIIGDFDNSAEETRIKRSRHMAGLGEEGADCHRQFVRKLLKICSEPCKMQTL